MMMTCKHKRGDYVLSYWLCADCFTKLQQRPSKYRMVPTGSVCLRNEDGPKSTRPHQLRQEISWQARVATSNEGTTFSRFIGMIAERFVRRGKLQKEEAIDMAIEALKSLADLGDRFGDADFSWDRDAAYQIADDEMSYWESGDGGANE